MLTPLVAVTLLLICAVFSLEGDKGTHCVPKQTRDCYGRILSSDVSQRYSRFSIHCLISGSSSPLTAMPNGPVDKPVNKIAKRLDITPEQVLIAWAKAKGAVILTYVTA